MIITETNNDPLHGDYGRVTGVEITNSGGGYVAGDVIGYNMKYSNSAFVLFVDAVDVIGAVTKVCWAADGCATTLAYSAPHGCSDQAPTYYSTLCPGDAPYTKPDGKWCCPVPYNLDYVEGEKGSMRGYSIDDFNSVADCYDAFEGETQCPVENCNMHV